MGSRASVVIMEIKEILEGRCGRGEATVHVSDRGSLVFQGPEVRAADGLVLNVGERAVEVSAEVVREALDAFDH